MDNLRKPIFNEFEAETIISTTKHKEWLVDENLARIYFIGTELEVEKYINNLNCKFLIAGFKLPHKIHLNQGAHLLKKLAVKSHPNAELFTLTDRENSNKITLFGIVRMLDDISESMPS